MMMMMVIWANGCVFLVPGSGCALIDMYIGHFRSLSAVFLCFFCVGADGRPPSLSLFFFFFFFFFLLKKKCFN